MSERVPQGQAGNDRLIVSATPFEKRPVDTPKIMRHVIYALLPATILAIGLFGLSALLLIFTCVAVCVATEWLVDRQGSIADASAVLTGLLLALTLPPGLPLWMAAIGALVAMVFGKLVFGGLGQNVFNPSLTGRAFLQASFPVAMTTWAAPGNLSSFWTLRGDSLAIPLLRPEFDAVSAATPLARMKFESELTDLAALAGGNISGSVGETSALLLILGGLYLMARGFLNWRIPVGILVTVALLATALHGVDSARFEPAQYQLLSGGLMLGAFYMATDPVTSPVTPRGCWIFAVGIGVLVVLIRQFGGLPEGVMYAILLMNAATPLIDRFTQPAIYGSRGAPDG
ncbi:MAG: RnfABCDGE type electron transport complex subunit D [Candidatus Competibacterales bacterium]|nr:RnfABCDGE type electron transport complex subunit D [Candidatus Competibacterales bacterium]